jgi:predicted protein tyrosine phosphatase
LDKSALIKRLMEIPGEIRHGETVLIDLMYDAQAAKDQLASKEAELLLSGAIDGKNAEIRNAQMREDTTMEREAVAEAERILALHRIDLTELQNEFKALRSISQLLSGTEVE